MKKSIGENKVKGLNPADGLTVTGETLMSVEESEEAKRRMENVGHSLEEIVQTIKDLEGSAMTIVKETAVAHALADELNRLLFSASVDTVLFHDGELEALSERTKGFAECTMATAYPLSALIGEAVDMIKTAGKGLAALEASSVCLVNAVRYLIQRADAMMTDLYGESAA